MRIGLRTWGSDGNIRPMSALADGLRARGHTVTIAVTSIDNKEYRPLAESLGVVLRPVGRFDPSGEKYEGLAAKLMELSPSSILKQFRLVMETLFEPVEEEMFHAAESLCAKSGLVIGHFLLHPLHAAAERSGSPM
ncbi:MAG: hypothetical protein K8I29_20080 [Alphaproteobacteria bacterium]|uniref:Uncharacterized protein n=1 Tax=Candidatus Nitrobium versatile TaxID=2884831 RepID=A0A953SHD4_9BACT|nr:hypothetical protein [Candidatus Nitrobium versatile]